MKTFLPMSEGHPINFVCSRSVSYTHLRAHETRHDLVCRLLLEKKKKNPVFVCVVDMLCVICVTVPEGLHVKSNGVKARHIPRINTKFYTWHYSCSGLLLGCTLHGRVDNGYTLLS